MKLICDDCWSIVMDDDVITCEHCGSRACPTCNALETLHAACEYEGCKEMAGCGTPTPDGYMWSCHKHKPK